MICHLDFETASKLDLTKVGSSRYSRDEFHPGHLHGVGIR